MKRVLSFAALLMLPVAASAATIRIDPVLSTILAGEMDDVHVRITDVVDLYAYQFDLTLDPPILSATSVSEGAFLSGGGGGTFFSPGVIDNTAGTITFTANTLLGPIPGVSGSGTLATIRFYAVSLGTGTIALSNIVLLDSALGDISVEVQNGAVSTVPEPNSRFLLAGVIGLCLLGRYWRMHR